MTSAPLLPAGAWFAGGIALGLPGALPLLPAHPLLLACTALCAAAAGLAAESRPSWVRGAAWLAFALAGLAAGSGVRASPPGIVEHPAVTKVLRAGRAAELEGRLREAPWTQDGRLRLRIDLLRIDRIDVAVSGPRGIRLTVSGVADAGRLQDLWPGDRLRITARLRRPRSFANPGAFDYPAYLRRRDIVLLGTVKSPLLVEHLAAGANGPARLLSRWRARLGRSLAAAVGEPEGGRRTALLSAMLLGDRSDLTPADRETMTASGLFHLLAISGMHVGLLLWTALGVLRRCGLRADIARSIVLCMLPAYAGLTGMHASVVRAGWMAGVLLVALLLRRQPSARNGLGLSAMVVLSLRPDSLADQGLLLSFSAVAFLLLLTEPLQEWMPGPRWLRRPLAASTAAALGVTPILAASVHQVAPLTVPANLVAVPLAGVALVAAAAATTLETLVPGAGAIPGRIGAFAAELLLGLGRMLAPWSWPTPGPSAALLAACYALSLACLLPGPAWRRRLAAGLLLLALAATVAGWPGQEHRGTLQLHLLDVSQGDAILLRLPDGAAVLIDGGGFSGTSFDVGSAVVAPALWHLGVRRLDAVVGTHAHHDHLGGLPAVVRRIPTGEVWLPPGARGAGIDRLTAAAQERGTPLRRVRRGFRRRFGGALVEVLHPGDRREDGPTNEESLVLRVSLGRRCLLLTGDAGAPAERLLLRQATLRECDVLKVGHHGSRGATSAALLARLQPRLALIPVGEGNPWNHPHPQTLRRLCAAGVEVLRTDRHGAIQVETDGRWLLWSVQEAVRQPGEGCRHEAEKEDHDTDRSHDPPAG